MRESVGMKAVTEAFAVSAGLAVNKNKTAEDAEVLAVSASLFYTDRDKRRRNDEKIF